MNLTTLQVATASIKPHIKPFAYLEKKKKIMYTNMEAGKRQAAAYVCLFIPATEGLLLYHSLFFFFFSSFDHHHSVSTKA
jgi:hypothetical protein